MTVTKKEWIDCINSYDFRQYQVDKAIHFTAGDTTHSIVENYRTTGSNYPDWRWRIKMGHDATTTLVGRKYSRSSSPLTAVANVTWDPAVGNPSSLPGSATLVAETHSGFDGFSGLLSEFSADNQAINRFVQRCRGVQTTFQGGVALGEIGQTLRMLASPAKTLRSGLSSYLATLKKRKRQVKRVSPRKRLSTARKILADTWLEYSFGWKPLISDINDAMKLLINTNSVPSPRVPVHASAKLERSGDLTYGQYAIGLLTVGWRCSHVENIVVTYRGSVNMEQPALNATAHAGIFRPDEFLPTVWELIPYSFLVDYFANIDDIISAATFNRSNLRWVNRTVRRETIVTRLGILPQCQYSIWYITRDASGHPGLEVNSLTEVSRGSYLGSLIPSLEFTTPGFGTKWINMAALAVGQRALVPFHR